MAEEPKSTHKEVRVIPYLPSIARLSAFLIRAKTHAPYFLRVGRPAAFASEVGEATMRGWNKRALVATYGISGLYVIADTAYHVHEAEEGEKMEVFVEKTIFHSLASLLLPSVVIHKIVHIVKDLVEEPKNAIALERWIRPKLHVRVPSIVAMISIPLVIIPIDYGVEHCIEFVKHHIL